MTAPTPLPWHDQQAAYAAQRAAVRAAVEAVYRAGGAMGSGEAGKAAQPPEIGAGVAVCEPDGWMTLENVR